MTDVSAIVVSMPMLLGVMTTVVVTAVSTTWWLGRQLGALAHSITSLEHTVELTYAKRVELEDVRADVGRVSERVVRLEERTGTREGSGLAVLR